MSDPTTKPGGRLRAAWQVLMGRRVVPFQIQAEWIEYKVTFDDIFSKLSAALARQAKVHKAMMAELAAEQDTEPQAISGGDRREEVRRKAAGHAAQLRAKQSGAAAHLKVVNGPGPEEAP